MNDTLPLLGARDLEAPLAWRDGVPVSAARFVAEAEALAETLPAQPRVVNLCRDRYRFALGFAAALLRGQTSLLPPNTLPETLARLAAASVEPPHALVDHDDAGALRPLRVEPVAVAPARAVPQIPAALEAVCLLTSGSTGAPQPHSRRWRALAAAIDAEAARLAELLERPSIAGLHLVATVPPQHSYGFESTVMLALLGGAAFDAGRPFYPADIAAALARAPRPRALVTTPVHLKALLRSGVALPPADLVLSATAPLPPALAAEAEARCGARLVEIYGCTEAGQVATRRTATGEVWQTLGALRLRREESDGDERFVAEGGHVEAPTPLADALELLDARRFRLLGRANDLIHVAGKRSSLAHLNFQLQRIEGVLDGAFWLPDEVPGEVVRPLAFVVAPALTARQVSAALRRHLEGAFVPRRIVHVEALPREASGKLGARAMDRFARETLAALDGHELVVPADHPAFAGHFPGRPVLPGALLLSFVFEALAARPVLAERLGPAPLIEQAKFLGAVGPGAVLRLFLRAQGEGVAFEVRRGTAVVARGQLGQPSK